MKSTSHDTSAEIQMISPLRSAPWALIVAIIAQLLGEFLVTQQLMFQQSAANGTGPPEICGVKLDIWRCCQSYGLWALSWI